MRRGERVDRSHEIAEVNAIVPSLAQQAQRRSGEWLFMCECGEAGCHTRVLLTLREYELHRESGRPLLAKDHHVTSSELIRRRARGLATDARALRAQAAHQLRRARRNCGA